MLPLRLFAVLILVSALAQIQAETPDQDGAYKSSQQVREPSLLRGAPAQYPKEAGQARHISAVDVVVGTDGTQTKLKILNAHIGPFEKSAVSAIKLSKFTSGSFQDQPAPVHVTAWFSRSSLPPAETANSKTVKVYKSEQVTAPELLPTDFTTVADPVCQDPFTGDVEFAAIVDSSGNPRNVFPTRPAGNALDQLASAIVERDHFKAGQKDGTAVPVSITVDIQLEACRVSETDAYGNVIPKLRPSKQPLQKIGPSKNFEPESVPVSALFGDSDTHLSPAKPHSSTIAPVPISTPEAKYTEQARMMQIQGVCLITLIVNAYGSPQNIRVVKSLGYGLDENAIEAVKSYRFKPAIRDGHAIAIQMTIEVRFRL